ncbi:PREDICTED: uncharacterized protein LOC105463048 [Wasmannia auropunctata]|uniref:uncharacterized protein LOC105463048 n=1 Tax=Wasmannia auropunctata TaxID=64793 RepID=UPI0005EE4D45|nr:PREDICTED: uncharacterized protein LOC105463048 [Wasmannia auropunctata]
MCPENHPLYKCKVFAKQSIDNRYNTVKSNRLCHNCFKSGHHTPACPSKSRCSHCQKPHHSLLHRDYATSSDAQNSNTPADSTNAPVASGSTASTAHALVQAVPPQLYAPRQILLATAWVNVHTCEGRTVRARALLDQGSTFSFISESLCQTLRTRRQRTHLQIRCFGDKYTGAARSCVPLSLSSCVTPGSTFPLLAYVYQKITAYAASQTQPVDSWPHLRGLALADSDPSSRDPIHLLIGADLYGSLLQNDIRQGPPGTPTAQSTVFGWVLSGPAGTSPSPSSSAQVNTCAAIEDLNSLVQRFWSDEDVPSSSPPLTDDEQKCEEHFASSYTRTPQGRYVVRLPFREAPPLSIGASFPIARKLYARLEQRLLRDTALAQAYHDFLREYHTLGHMERVSEIVPPPHRAAYIPHHAVTREESSTTKLRVVFNASCRTSSGTTLNEHLLIGPKLQQDLAAIMLRWRQFQFVYTADVAKMYRQILVHPDDVDYQRILWRPPGASDLQHYRLLTVTYGTACAPYLALKVLQQLATDDGHLFPKAVPIVRDSIYVDDALFGADEITQLVELREQLVSLLKRGQFTLRKWTANTRELLNDLPPDQKAISDLHFCKDDSLKVLGLSWLPREDAFQFKVSCYNAIATKRSVLAFTAKLYDPHGWAAPAIIPAKILMQELWLASGKARTIEQKKAIQETIQGMALEVFQLGLREETQTIVRSRNYATLEEAILGATAEKKLKRPQNKANYYNNRYRNEQGKPKVEQSASLQCHKCGKTGHIGQECRTSRYANRFNLARFPRGAGPRCASGTTLLVAAVGSEPEAPANP